MFKRETKVGEKPILNIEQMLQEVEDAGLEVDLGQLSETEYILGHVLPYAMSFDVETEDQLTIEDPNLLGIKFGFYMQFGSSEGGKAFARITLMKSAPQAYGVQLIDIVQAAERNIIPEIKPFIEMGIPCADTIAAHGRPLYSVSAAGGSRGAGVLLDPDLPAMIKEKIGADEFYLLPSSVHELIAVPYACMDPKELAFLLRTVRLINELLVDKEERLSNNIFKYDGTRFSTVINPV